jgi:hypothetical protein
MVSGLVSTPAGAAGAAALAVLVLAVLAFFLMGRGGGSGDLAGGGPLGNNGQELLAGTPLDELRGEADRVAAYIKITEAALRRAYERKAVIDTQLAEMLAEVDAL